MTQQTLTLLGLQLITWLVLILLFGDLRSLWRRMNSFKSQTEKEMMEMARSLVTWDKRHDDRITNLEFALRSKPEDLKPGWSMCSDENCRHYGVPHSHPDEPLNSISVFRDPHVPPDKDKLWTDMLNRRVPVENILNEVAVGKRPPLTPEQCRDLALRLGDPQYQPRKELW